MKLIDWLEKINWLEKSYNFVFRLLCFLQSYWDTGYTSSITIKYGTSDVLKYAYGAFLYLITIYVISINVQNRNLTRNKHPSLSFVVSFSQLS